MYSLFQFLYRNRAFLTFLFLEVISFWLVLNDRSYLGAKFFNSSNRLAANVLNISSNVSDYFSLGKVNAQLAEENRQLHEILLNQTPKGIDPIRIDSVSIDSVNHVYEMIAAKVINNSTRRVNNYLTINKGSDDGILPGMGVVGPQGIVGKVKYSSKHFSSVISLLHTEFLISTAVKRNQVYGTLRWTSGDALYADLQYVPRHVSLQVGDTIVTSGFNTIFPEGYQAGTISEFTISDDATFYTVKVKLATDFYSLRYVYVVKNLLAEEKDSLEQVTIPDYE
ncbi:rod shape-determining protein MreC [uncultured Imperialibacter sp.]|uniref:rod shape-determining protein MreC n=1 Tax=uncultured Imperialibacter sp. TaxID=1672639 RepID=UPI0030D767ED|tara:strand:+ start:6399 stop:7241 length:843 start_codon:yes stop_codon:yes gene_type:complete